MPRFDYPGIVSKKYYFNRHQPTPLRHRVTLAVGQVFVTGEGPSPQAARHHAAQQALEQLRNQIPVNKAQLDGKFSFNCFCCSELQRYVLHR